MSLFFRRTFFFGVSAAPGEVAGGGAVVVVVVVVAQEAMVVVVMVGGEVQTPAPDGVSDRDTPKDNGVIHAVGWEERSNQKQYWSGRINIDQYWSGCEHRYTIPRERQKSNHNQATISFTYSQY